MWTDVGKQSDVITRQLSLPARGGQDGRHRSGPSAGRKTQDQTLPITALRHDIDIPEATKGRGHEPGPQSQAVSEMYGSVSAVGSADMPPRPAGPPAAMSSQTHNTHQTDNGHTHTARLPDFDRVRKVCDKANYDVANIDLRPCVFSKYKREFWPLVSAGSMPMHMEKIYDVVRSTGLPNALAARIPVPTNLNLKNWADCLQEIGGRDNILDFLTFGFPLGYVGPVSNTVGVQNHPSANDYPAHVTKFLNHEIELGGILGPFSTPPFSPWCHTSPLMSRPKNNGDRRIITDMTFPPDVSVNAFIVKNGIYGIEMEHSLPTIDNLVQCITRMPRGAVMSTLDISRAYQILTQIHWIGLCCACRGRTNTIVTSRSDSDLVPHRITCSL